MEGVAGTNNFKIEIIKYKKHSDFAGCDLNCAKMATQQFYILQFLWWQNRPKHIAVRCNWQTDV